MLDTGSRRWSLVALAVLTLFALSALAKPKAPPPPPQPGDPGTVLFSSKVPPKKFKNKKARMEAFAKGETEFKADEEEEWTIHFNAFLTKKAGSRNLQLWFIDITEDPDNEKAVTIFQITAKKKAKSIIEKVVLDTEDWEADQKLKLRVVRVNAKKGVATVLAEGTFTLK